MRGLSMILVVLCHIFLFMDEKPDGTALAAILISWRMPLFFFISGYFAYRSLNRWSKNFTKQILLRKFRAQVLCATVFFMLFAIVCHKPPFGFIHKGYDYYWFTIALFQMFLIYMLMVSLCKCFQKDFSGIGMLILIIPAIAYFYNPSWHTVNRVLSWFEVSRYFPFFAMGIIAHQYWNKFEKLLHSDTFRTIILIIFIGGCFYLYADGYRELHGFFPRIFQDLIHRTSGVLTVFIFFYSRADFFNSNAPISRFLCFSGKRTLDIYMLHYFFTPHLDQLEWTNVLNEPGMMIIKFTITLIIAIIVTCLCLLCSNILRSSAFLSKWLLGTK